MKSPPKQKRSLSQRKPKGRDGARAAIVAAAVQVFAERGFDGATTRQIAAAAGIEVGHLTYYFASKAQLWTAVVEECSRDLLELIENELKGDDLRDPTASARRVLPKFIRHLAVNRFHTRIMQHEFTLSSPRHDWVVTEFGKRAWELLAPLFRRLDEDGRLRGASPISSYFTLVGSALVFFGSAEEVRMIAGVDATSDEIVSTHIETLLSGLLI